MNNDVFFYLYFLEQFRYGNASVFAYNLKTSINPFIERDSGIGSFVMLF